MLDKLGPVGEQHQHQQQQQQRARTTSNPIGSTLSASSHQWPARRSVCSVNSSIGTTGSRCSSRSSSSRSSSSAGHEEARSGAGRAQATKPPPQADSSLGRLVHRYLVPPAAGGRPHSSCTGSPAHPKAQFTSCSPAAAAHHPASCTWSRSSLKGATGGAKSGGLKSSGGGSNRSPRHLTSYATLSRVPGVANLKTRICVAAGAKAAQVDQQRQTQSHHNQRRLTSFHRKRAASSSPGSLCANLFAPRASAGPAINSSVVDVVRREFAKLLKSF